MKTCKTCIACRPSAAKPDVTGECMMNPPMVQLVMVQGQRSLQNPNGQPQLAAQRFYPPVDMANDYCMQHMAAPTAK